MNFPTAIADIESELRRVLGMYEEDERALSESATPEVERIFLASTKKLRDELETRLRCAKAERAHESIGHQPSPRGGMS